MATMRLGGRTKNITKRSKDHLEGSLPDWLFRNGGDEINVRHQLNEFTKSRKRIYKWEVGDAIKKLRERKYYLPALKLSEKMHNRGIVRTVSDQAIHLDLIAKNHGVSAAEKFFADLPERTKNIQCYGALLNCYCKDLMTEKAEALFEKMKELGLSLASMNYNSLMTMYTKTGSPEKVAGVIQEMKESDIKPDTFTYNVWMRALAACKDISGVESVIDEMTGDERVALDWTTYSNLATIYVNAGYLDKAESALKELEKRNTSREVFAYKFLISLYGRIGNLEETYRIWRAFRVAYLRTPGIGYLTMIETLVKLNDLPGAEACFNEWEKGCIMYDFRIANALIFGYLKAGLLEKAENLRVRACRRGPKPNANTWKLFLDYHLKNGKMKSAMDCLDKAVSVVNGNGNKFVPSNEALLNVRWYPSDAIISVFLNHFERAKDVDGAEAFVEILTKSKEFVGSGVLESLIRTYAAAGKTSPFMRRRLKMEKVELSEACEKLLDVVCKED